MKYSDLTHLATGAAHFVLKEKYANDINHTICTIPVLLDENDRLSFRFGKDHTFKPLGLSGENKLRIMDLMTIKG